LSLLISHGECDLTATATVSEGTHDCDENINIYAFMCVLVSILDTKLVSEPWQLPVVTGKIPEMITFVMQ